MERKNPPKTLCRFPFNFLHCKTFFEMCSIFSNFSKLQILHYLLSLPSLNEVVFQDVQAAHHLGEDEHLVSSSLHLGQQFVNKYQLPGRLHHGLQVKVDCSRTTYFPEVLQDLLFCPWCSKNMDTSEILFLMYLGFF